MDINSDSLDVNSILPLGEKILDSFSDTLNPQPPLLPRSAWTSQVAYMRVLFRVKKRLDQIENTVKEEIEALNRVKHSSNE
jgi:hypothetical protein